MSMNKPFPVLLLLAMAWAQETPPEGVNREASAIQEFQKRVSDYMTLRKSAAEGLPSLKPTASPTTIVHHERELARRIQAAREGAKLGDIFAPAIEKEFRRLIGIAMQGQAARHVKQSLKRAEPVVLPLHVNDWYPTGIPLQSTPPTLILNLPELPKGLDYRVVGHNLVLRDAEANIIVDFISNAIP
jgi:hypothetical protein